MYLEKLDFERRMAVEKEVEKHWDLSKAKKSPESGEDTAYVMPALGFDESDTYLYYGTPIGIKIMNIRTG